MENENRNSRVRQVTDIENSEATGAVRADSAGTSVPRSQRVAPSLRTGSSGRSRTDTQVRQGSSARRPAASGSTTAAGTRASGTRTAGGKTGSRQTSSVRNSSAAAAGTRASGTRTAGSRPVKKSAPNKKTASKKKSVSKKKSRTWFGRLSKFKKFMLIYSAAFLLLIIIAAIALTSYLRKFEAGQPGHTVEAVIESLGSEEKTLKFINDNSSIISPDMTGLEDTYYPLIEGKELTFIGDSDNTTQNSGSYFITADGSRVATVALEKTGSDSWKISGIDLSAAYKDAKEYSILVPEGSEVTVNGKTLGEDKITGTGIPAILEYSSQFIESKPEFTTYTIKSITGEVPQVSGTDPMGQELVFTASETAFVAGGGAGQTFIDDVTERVEAGVDEYALYFEYLAFNLRDYIVEESETYAQIFGSENYDPINPGLYMYEYIDTYDFTEKTISDYIVYAEDCFTVDVKFHLVITFTDYGPYGYQDLPDDNITMDATWVWVKEGDTWKISDIILNG